MKQAKKPNRKQKGILEFCGLNSDDYLFLRTEENGMIAVFIHRKTREVLRVGL